jgi:hypothetical protein
MPFVQLIQSKIPPSMNRRIHCNRLAVVTTALSACASMQPTAFALRSVPFRLAGIGTTGREFMMAPPDTPMTSDELAYSLRLDMGNCSLRQTIPCIRYAWMRLRKSSPTATVGSFYQHSRTHPTIPRQPEQQAALPGYRAELPQSEADIRAFDAAVRQLIAPTVQLLMDDIQGVKAMK